jgi:hypothetical protein
MPDSPEEAGLNPFGLMTLTLPTTRPLNEPREPQPAALVVDPGRSSTTSTGARRTQAGDPVPREERPRASQQPEGGPQLQSSLICPRSLRSSTTSAGG